MRAIDSFENALPYTSRIADTYPKLRVLLRIELAIRQESSLVVLRTIGSLDSHMSTHKLRTVLGMELTKMA